MRLFYGNSMQKVDHHSAEVKLPLSQISHPTRPSLLCHKDVSLLSVLNKMADTVINQTSLQYLDLNPRNSELEGTLTPP